MQQEKDIVEEEENVKKQRTDQAHDGGIYGADGCNVDSGCGRVCV